MTIDDKRKVIEVLMAAASTRDTSVFGASFDFGYSTRTATLAMERRRSAWASMQCDKANHYSQSATAAAYRLIESSPTLRREWFRR